MAQESRILIVDDETIVRITLSRRLRNYGYDCAEAYDYHSAISVLNNVRIDLVLADINMPEKSGMELLKVVKHNWAATGVIMMTGMAKVDTAANCLKMGAADFITKPFDWNRLSLAVRQSLQKSREPVQEHALAT